MSVPATGPDDSINGQYGQSAVDARSIAASIAARVAREISVRFGLVTDSHRSP